MPLDYTPRTLAFPHQLEASRFITGKPAVALFDEQGLGKSKIVLDALLTEIAAKSIDGALIVCKHSLLPMWENEIRKHTKVQGVVLSGSPGQAGLSLMIYSPFYVTSYSLLHREIPRIRQLLEMRRMALVLDESHAIKNPSARVTQEVLAIGPLAHQRVILSGTPVANYPEDLWSQFYFLDQGKTLGGDFEAFRLFYDLGLGLGRRRVSSSHLKEIADRIRPITLRRTKKGTLELPEKQYETLGVDLKGRQAKMYLQVRDELRLELLKDGKLIQTLDIENVLERLLRLVQVCSNPILVDPRFSEVPAKFRELRRILERVVSNDEKAIVWTQFVANVKILAREYEKFGSAAIHGSVPIAERQKIVDRFQDRADKKLIFAVPGAAREGLTLTAANHAIYLDRGFNLVDYIQSQDRIHRIGQERACLVTKLIAKGTIDEFVEEVLTRKAEIADTIENRVRPHVTKAEVDPASVERVLSGV